MSLLRTSNQIRSLLGAKSVLIESRAWINARRKDLRKKYSLEAGRRISVYFPNPNSHPALLNGPDFSYQDHRPVPYGVHQYKRVCQNIEYTDTIIKLNKEIDSALEMERTRNEETKAAINKILENKLKPKGGVVQGGKK